MEKKKRDVSLPKRFNSEDVKTWQEQAIIRKSLPAKTFSSELERYRSELNQI